MDKIFSYIGWTFKYRPVNWNEVIGQNKIIHLIINTIKKNFLSQILLFSGPKGVGKNTCARILANELNFFSKKDSSLNIFNINGIFNHSEEFICKIIKKIRLFPKEGKYNILILNNIHHINKNYFLSIIDNPPPHVLFVFCTEKQTEIINYILHIHSYQIYEFEHISLKKIFFYLKKIAEKEGLKIDNEALFIISKYGNGSIEKAILTLEKLSFFQQENRISSELVMEKLGILQKEEYFKITDYILDGKKSNILIFLDKIFQKKINPISFIDGLINHFRHLFLSKNIETLFLLKCEKKNIKFYIEQSKRLYPSFLIKSLIRLHKIKKEFYNYSADYLLIEINLLQLTKDLDLYFKDKYDSYKKNPNQFKKKIKVLEENWKNFLQKLSERIKPNYLIFLEKIKFSFSKDRILLVVPYELYTCEFYFFIKTYFLKYIRKKLNEKNLEFKIEIKEKNVDDFSVKKENSLFHNNKLVDQLIERLELKISSSILL
ncbi:AAA family ATPase [Blattabacterium cuenoti]|uniref:AAA family ATPase n=1 Tax=Blattabacterium cuenoti TaxID=1653831 RepID=UPI00163C3AD0|nr:AAA family ATPase [Blattabacterium cuenoti]